MIRSHGTWLSRSLSTRRPANARPAAIQGRCILVPSRRTYQHILQPRVREQSGTRVREERSIGSAWALRYLLPRRFGFLIAAAFTQAERRMVFRPTNFNGHVASTLLTFEKRVCGFKKK